MVGPITQGKDFNFFQKVTVSSANFNASADVAINIRNQAGLILSNETTGSVVEYSFNGNTLHGDLTFGQGSQTIKFDNRRVNFIWLRLKSGGTATVRVEAWAGI